MFYWEDVFHLFLLCNVLNPVCSKVYCHPSNLASCICRCNNVMYLRGVPEDEDAAEDND